MPRKYIKGIEARLIAYIDKSGDCWDWLGQMHSQGYGVISTAGKMHLAHRFVYEKEVGPIPAGLTLDHLCRNRKCVNPEHLEPVTIGENARRGKLYVTHCPHGHAYAGDNLIINKKGWRDCRTCRRKNTIEQSIRRKKLAMV
jgi:hypothetical protein